MRWLFSPYHLGPITLDNRIVMAPLTRCRAEGNVPNALMAEYYAQRASVGLIITEGTSPSPNGLGYARIPGIFTQEQVDAWRLITEAVHGKGGRIFLQIMHTGRVGHPLNLPPGARVLAPSAVALPGEIWTDQQGLAPHPVPQAMSLEDIAATQREYVQAALNARAAGFDGVELHAANGYLLEQFIRPNTNLRTDAYGGTIANRARFVLEVAEAVAQAIGRERVGIRLSPYGVFNDMPVYPQMEEDYAYLVGRLSDLGLVYLHLVDHSAMGAPPVPETIKRTLRGIFKQSLILVGGYDAVRAEQDLAAGHADLIAVGRALIANPDLVARWQQGAPLNTADPDTFYTPGPKGYTDYPFLS